MSARCGKKQKCATPSAQCQVRNTANTGIGMSMKYEYECKVRKEAKVRNAKCATQQIQELVLSMSMSARCGKKQKCAIQSAQHSKYIELARPYIYRYIPCTYGIFGREITIHTVIYGVYIRFWLTLDVYWTQELV